MELRSVKFRVIETESQLRQILQEHMNDKIWQEHFVFDTPYGTKVAQLKVEYSTILGETRYFLDGEMSYKTEPVIQRAIEYKMIKERV